MIEDKYIFDDGQKLEENKASNLKGKFPAEYKTQVFEEKQKDYWQPYAFGNTIEPLLTGMHVVSAISPGAKSIGSGENKITGIGFIPKVIKVSFQQDSGISGGVGKIIQGQIIQSCNYWYKTTREIPVGETSITITDIVTGNYPNNLFRGGSLVSFDEDGFTINSTNTGFLTWICFG